MDLSSRVAAATKKRLRTDGRHAALYGSACMKRVGVNWGTKDSVAQSCLHREWLFNERWRGSLNWGRKSRGRSGGDWRRTRACTYSRPEIIYCKSNYDFWFDSNHTKRLNNDHNHMIFRSFHSLHEDLDRWIFEIFLEKIKMIWSFIYLEISS